MKEKFKFLLLFLFAFALGNCESNSDDLNEVEFTDENGYIDGTYCAEINYYNPKTGTNSTYQLNVDVLNNQVTTIFWNNGGWLDEDHFNPEDLNSYGFCSFTSDKGYEYEIQILGAKCNETDDIDFKNDIQNDFESITCPKCGDEKETYNDYCDNCQDDVEHTCKRCGEVDFLMFPTDEFCSNCEEMENVEND